MSTTATFNKKALYHSDLQKAGQLLIKFTGTPRDSQYPGKPRWVGLMVDGDDTKYTLSIENPGVEKTIAGVPVNTWVLVRAGGRAEDASMVCEDANGNPVFGGVPQQEIAQGPPPNEWPAKLTPAPSHPVNTNGDVTVQRAAALTIQAVAALKNAGIPVEGDAAARIFNTLYIQASR